MYTEFLIFLVIYDNDITDCFIKTLERLLNKNDLNTSGDKEVYIALEKRYVFTLAELDTIAPCYEYFLQRVSDVQKSTHWKLEAVDLNFPQYVEYYFIIENSSLTTVFFFRYFDYERSKELIIMKLTA